MPPTGRPLAESCPKLKKFVDSPPDAGCGSPRTPPHMRPGHARSSLIEIPSHITACTLSNPPSAARAFDSPVQGPD